MPGPYVIAAAPVDGSGRTGAPLYLPEAELSWRFSRSSGPGGQHVNTSDSRVELSLDLAATAALPEELRERALQRLAGRLRGGVLTVRVSTFRSQWRNREEAARRMAALLADAVAPPPRARRSRRVSRGSNERRLRQKKARGDVKRGRAGDGWD
ncbi:alternative ribosome rescue aminoacyl-tRNA hydrolase ArfB [Streptomyces lonarensis]|uniref:Aminoacyl-tRNA hydrolase n=1 Tax=Streptomyces lonarensis TaxID=700599 RepID=A0A7X6D052_9ACTN|nr:alternative ribosome rescue aminoacyl-tRNA hydrolase ArfB [Streptomyces lonarensis]NJQ05720.1 aminoacyl-tRNA hydrolase [Streptomyces lonarensis]